MTSKHGSPCPFQEVYSVYRILAGILNIGNIEFAAISSQHQTDKSEVPNAEALENGNWCLHAFLSKFMSFASTVFQESIEYDATVPSSY